MTFAKLQTAGHGTLKLRLMIEGWPIMWVSHPSITATSILDGRTVLPGLHHRGLVIDDRVIMQDAKAEARGNTFRISPPYGGSPGLPDPLFASLSLVPDDVAQLGADLDEHATTISVTLGASLSDNTVYHIGTEAIRVGTFPAITRHIWDTQPQKHNLLNFDLSNTALIYPHPPTMEGRRAFLYAYGSGDDMAGEGQCIWRGQVARAPTLDPTDGVTWLIETNPITDVLRQTVAGGAGESAVIGIYHHRYCAVYCQFKVDDEWQPPHYYSGFDRNEEDLLASVNAMLAAALAATTFTIGGIDRLRLQTTDEGLRLVLYTLTGVSSFAVRFGSPLIGFIESGIGGGFWQRGPNTDPNATTGTMIPQPGEGAILHWVTQGEWYLGPFLTVGAVWPSTFAAKVYEGSNGCYALGNVASILVSPEYFINPDPTAQATWPEWRIFVEHSFEGARSVYFEGLRAEDDLTNAIQTPPALIFAVALTGVELVGGQVAHFIDLVPSPHEPEFLIIVYPSNEPTVTVLRAYSQHGTVADFVQEVKNEAVYANDGDTPWITDADLSTWDVAVNAPPRAYQFAKELKLEEILAPDLQLIGYFMRLEADGRIGVASLPLPTETYLCDEAHTITTASITTPREQIIPGYAPQRDGVLTTVEIYEDYDVFEDEWMTRPPPFVNQEVIATHKRRGQTQMEIKPYSRPAAANAINFRDIAERYLRFFGRDYVVITVQVSWKHFAVLCGDVVSLTHSKLPAGDGTRGIAARKCVCVARSWNLAPGSSDRMGTLELWMPSSPVSGYAPGGFVTGQVNDSGNVWTLTLDVANALNIAVSTSNNGRVLEHFFAGDFIRLVQRDADTPTEVTGIVSATPDPAAGTVEVTLDGAWTPGASSWRLEFQRDVGGLLSSTSQRRYAYVADSSGALPTGGRGRVLS